MGKLFIRELEENVSALAVENQIPKTEIRLRVSGGTTLLASLRRSLVRKDS